MKNEALINKRYVKKNRGMKLNQKAAKKLEKPRKLFDFSTKIYKATSLSSDQVLDLTSDNEAMIYDQKLMPEDSETILERIEKAEIKGLSGGGFPSAVKIKTAMAASEKDKYFIINAVECDPGLLHDEWLLTHQWSAVELGIRAVCRIMKFKKVIVASRHHVNYKVNLEDTAIEFKQLGYLYPLGEEHILINNVLGDISSVDSKTIPAEKGILMLNLQTVMAIGQAVLTDKAQDSRYITVVDLKNGDSRICRVSYGTSADLVLKKVLGIKDDRRKFIGSGIMDSHEISKDEKIEEGTNFLAYGERLEFADPSACRKCGQCRKKCPEAIPVNVIIKELSRGKAVPQEYRDRCIGCNSCTYYCSAGINTRAVVQGE